MANYDVYKTIRCPVTLNSSIYDNIPEVTRIIEIPIIEWDSLPVNITNFDPSLVETPTCELFQSEPYEYVYAAISPDTQYSSSGEFIQIGANLQNGLYGFNYGVWKGGSRYGNASVFSLEFWTLCYELSSSATWLIVKRQGSNYYSRYTLYEEQSISFLPELYSLTEYGTKLPVNFYRSSSPGVIDSSPIELALGESSSQLEYTIVYEDGSFEVYNGEITYTGAHLDRAYTITDNVITVSDKTSLPSEIITARPSEYIDAEEYPTIFTFINLIITNPTGVYEDGDSDPLSPGLGPGGPGGGGYFGKNPSTGQPESSDPITIPAGSVAGDASATGMMTRYLANSSQLEIFGDWLWTDDLGLAIAKAGISLLYGSPAEAVISLMSYPFDISSLSGVTTRNQNLYWGNHNSGIGATALTSPAATIDWGTISLNEYWGNFLDYEPHTKIELYLPWGTGFVSVDPGQCLPGTLRVVTNIDLNKGSCVHNVFGNNGCVIGTYAGQCSQQIPIISNDYASKIAGVVTTATSLAVAGASGAVGAAKSADRAFDSFVAQNPLGVGGVPGDWMDRLNSTVNQAAVHGFSEGARQPAKLAAASSVAALRRTSNIARNGSFTDGSAALGCQYPYIILSRPSQSVPKEYGSHYGYPSNIFTQLSNLRGYTEVGEIHLNGIDATEPEIVELDKILKGGVIF